MKRTSGRTLASAVFLGLMIACVCSTALAQYSLTKLTADQSGKAKNTDPLLQNAWGLVYGPGGPFWVSDENNSWSTLYDGSGTPQSLQVVVHTASGTCLLYTSDAADE